MAPEPPTVEWRNEKWDGSLNRRAPLRLVHRDGSGVWLWLARGTIVEQLHRSYAHPCDAVAFVPAHGRWAATWLFDFEPALYVDITHGVEIGDTAIRSIDVDLDVVRHRDGSVQLLDEDEFAAHITTLDYPPELVEQASATARAVADDLAAFRSPFSVTPDEPRVAAAVASLRNDAHPLDDWMRAPNIAGDPATYELENEAIERDGRLDTALHRIAPWDGLHLLDIGCGTGFWLPRYARSADRVVGVEPDPTLVALADQRIRGMRSIAVVPGSAEHLPLDDASIDIAHARFAYFFGPGAEAGLAEVERVLRPGGALLAVDNSWSGGDFAELLHASDVGNATLDLDDTDRWWDERGAVRHEVEGGWRASSPDELERVLRIEFPDAVVDDFVAGRRPSAELSYRYAVYEWRR